MKLDVLGMEAFVSVAALGSLVRAAEALSVTSPALTRRLNNLESQLGVQLLERTTRSVALTAAGLSLLPRAQHLLEELSTTFRELAASGQAQRGTVTIACVPTVGVQFLPSLIRQYSRRHPDNRVRILDHTSLGVAEAVHRREAEFGINMADVQFSGLESTPILSDRFGLICRRDHPLGRRRVLRWADLKGHALIVPGGGSSNRPLLDAVLGPLNVQLPALYEVQRSSTAVGLAAQGLGAAIVPQLSIPPGAYPQLKLIDLVEPVVERSFVLVRRKGSALSPAARALHELIVARVRSGVADK
jgi:DNA-binding transcriptional LysR family regulator